MAGNNLHLSLLLVFLPGHLFFIVRHASGIHPHLLAQAQTPALQCLKPCWQSKVLFFKAFIYWKGKKNVYFDDAWSYLLAVVLWLEVKCFVIWGSINGTFFGLSQTRLAWHLTVIHVMSCQLGVLRAHLQIAWLIWSQNTFIPMRHNRLSCKMGTFALYSIT